MGCPLPTIHRLVPRRDKMFYSSPCSANLRICDLYYHSPWPGCDADPSPPSCAEVKNRVELYLYSP